MPKEVLKIVLFETAEILSKVVWRSIPFADFPRGRYLPTSLQRPDTGWRNVVFTANGLELAHIDRHGALHPYWIPTKKFKVGVVPHTSEKFLRTVMDLSGVDGVKIINVNDDIQSVIRSILECEIVCSSSLHGLIISDVLQVPNAWVRFNGDFPGDNFKFNDYYSSLESVSDLNRAPIFLDSKKDIPSFIASARRYSRVHEHHLNRDSMINVLGDHLKLLGLL